jgi:hypothetical protein
MNMNLIKTPKEVLMDKTGLLPKFNKGKKVKKSSIKDMEAELIVHGKVPPSLKKKKGK